MIFLLICIYFVFYFFFQAEDGIRDYKVTGVQTCALPIFFNATSILLLALVTPFAHAQSTGGRIRGTVTDPSGGAVVGATVTLINEATHATRDVQTGANGEYIFLERSEERRVGKEWSCRMSRGL